MLLASTVVLAIVNPFTSPLAVAADWQGSYSAAGSCYCIGQLPSHVSSQIIPTPVGGKTVSQVCKRLGSGPGLQKTDGKFNYPFYEDAQCGNGPAINDSANREAACAGTLDDSAGDCQPVGPRWNLVSAFASPAAASDAQQPSAVTSVIVDSQESSKVVDGKSLKTTVIRSASTANRAVDVANSGNTIDNFKGKSVTIGGQRYLQARNGLPAVGGAPGSRIVLDDLVYLLDDSSLDPNDLFQAPALAAANNEVAQLAQSEKKKLTQPPTGNSTSSNAVSESDTSKKKAELAASKAAADEKIAARKAAEAQAEKESRARIALEEEQRAREARLASEAADQESATRARELVAKEKARLRAAEEQRAAAETEKLEQAKSAQRQVEESEEQSTRASVAEASKSAAVRLKDSAGVLADTVTNALRLPPQVRASSRNFNYFEAMPASYDVGGTGLMLEGSGHRKARFHMLGRLGVSDVYQEFMVGGGYYLTPASANRMTVVLLAGIEHGSFELQDDNRAPGLSVDFDDTGLHFGVSSRVVLNNKFELKGGIGYSSFFGGDAMLTGGAYYHITPRLDAMSRFEIGDNDLFGIGIRYYY